MSRPSRPSRLESFMQRMYTRLLEHQGVPDAQLYFAGGFPPVMRGNPYGLFQLAGMHPFLLGGHAAQPRRHVPPPQVQQTVPIDSGMTLKKDTLKLHTEPDGRVHVSFDVDTSCQCAVTVMFFCVETFDERQLTKILAHDHFKMPTVTYEPGTRTTYRQGAERAIDVAPFGDEILHKEKTPRYPIVVEMRRLSGGGQIDTLYTYVTFVRNASGGLGVRLVKQRIEVGGKCYDLQEIYGLDSRSADGSGSASGSADDESNMCVICFSAPPEITVLPCRHFCLCQECADRLRHNSDQCPICRTKIDRLIHIQVQQQQQQHGVDTGAVTDAPASAAAPMSVSAAAAR